MKAYRFSIEELYFMKKIESFGSTFSFVRWPEVYWGNQPRNKDNEQLNVPENKFDADYLGSYNYTDQSEGHIELYSERIEDCANRISDNLDIPFDHVFSDLCFIVLMHEIGHWLTHWCHKDAFSERRLNFSAQPTEIKETLAQLTVVWSMMRLSNPSVHRKRSIFFHLVKHQSSPYQEVLDFEKYYTKKGTILKRYNDLLDEKEWGIQYLLDGKKHESFDQISRKLNKQKKEKFNPKS